MTLVAFALGNIAGTFRISLMIIHMHTALIPGTETFQPKDAPGYAPGKVAILILLTTQIFICFTLRHINIYMNKRKLKALEDEKVRRSWSDNDVERERQRHAFLDMTDKQ